MNEMMLPVGTTLRNGDFRVEKQLGAGSIGPIAADNPAGFFFSVPNCQLGQFGTLLADIVAERLIFITKIIKVL